MISLQMSIEPSLFYSVMSAAQSQGMTLEDYIRSRLVDVPAPGAINGEPPSAGAENINLNVLAHDLYDFVVKRPDGADPLRVEDMIKQEQPRTWDVLTVGQRKALGRIFGQLTDNLYGRGVDVDGKTVWVHREGKDSQNKMRYCKVVV